MPHHSPPNKVGIWSEETLQPTAHELVRASKQVEHLQAKLSQIAGARIETSLDYETIHGRNMDLVNRLAQADDKCHDLHAFGSAAVEKLQEMAHRVHLYEHLKSEADRRAAETSERVKETEDLLAQAWVQLKGLEREKDEADATNHRLSGDLAQANARLEAAERAAGEERARLEARVREEGAHTAAHTAAAQASLRDIEGLLTAATRERDMALADLKQCKLEMEKEKSLRVQAESQQKLAHAQSAEVQDTLHQLEREAREAGKQYARLWEQWERKEVEVHEQHTRLQSRAHVLEEELRISRNETAVAAQSRDALEKKLKESESTNQEKYLQLQNHCQGLEAELRACETRHEEVRSGLSELSARFEGLVGTHHKASEELAAAAQDKCVLQERLTQTNLRYEELTGKYEAEVKWRREMESQLFQSRKDAEGSHQRLARAYDAEAQDTARLMELEKVNEELLAQRLHFEALAQGLQTEIQALEQQNRTLWVRVERDTEQHALEVQAMKLEMNSSANNDVKVSHVVRELESRLEESQHELRASHAKATSLELDIVSMERTQKAMQERVRVSEEARSNLEMELTKLRATTDASVRASEATASQAKASLLADKTALQRENEDCKAELNRLKQQADLASTSSKHELNDLKVSKRTLEDENRKLKERVEHLRSRMEVLAEGPTKQIEQMQRDHEQFRKRSEEDALQKEQELCVLRKERRTMELASENTQCTQHQLKEAQESHARLTKELAEARRELDQAARAQHRLEDYAESEKQHTTEIHQLRQERAQLQHQLQQALQEHAACRAAQNSASEARAHAKTALSLKTEALEGELREARGGMAELEEENARMARQLAALEEENARMARQLAALETTARATEEERDRLKSRGTSVSMNLKDSTTVIELKRASAAALKEAERYRSKFLNAQEELRARSRSVLNECRSTPPRSPWSPPNYD